MASGRRLWRSRSPRPPLPITLEAEPRRLRARARRHRRLLPALASRSTGTVTNRVIEANARGSAPSAAGDRRSTKSRSDRCARAGWCDHARLHNQGDGPGRPRRRPTTTSRCASAGVPATARAAAGRASDRDRQAGGPPNFTPGARTLGDPLLPQIGNGGYDAQHYDISLNYDSVNNTFKSAVMTMRATATQDLSELSLDFQNLPVDKVLVNRQPATFSQVDATPVLAGGGTQPMKLSSTRRQGSSTAPPSRSRSTTTAAAGRSPIPTGRPRAGSRIPPHVRAPAAPTSSSASRWARRRGFHQTTTPPTRRASTPR